MTGKICADTCDLNHGLRVKAQLHYETQLNSTVVADKEIGPKTIQS